MEKKMNLKHHDHHKHGKTHRAQDAYELYDLEHRPHTLQKVPSLSPKARYPEPVRHEKGRTSAQHYWRAPKDGYGTIYEENNNTIDVEADDFIADEHDKFKMTNLKSLNSYQGSNYEGPPEYVVPRGYNCNMWASPNQ